MYIIKISDSNYKIILSKTDLSKYGSDVFGGGITSKAFFTEILEKLADDKGKLKRDCIANAEFFEDKFGGGELFISIKSNSSYFRRYIFYGKSIEEIITVSNVILQHGIDASSKLIYLNGIYHLIIFSQEENRLLTCVIGEFGKYKSASRLEVWHLEEHGRTIFNHGALREIVGIFSSDFHCSSTKSSDTPL